MDYASFLLYRAAVALFSLLPLKVVFLLGKSLGAFAYWLAVPYRKLVLANLTLAFGDEKSPAEIRSLAWGSYIACRIR